MMMAAGFSNSYDSSSNSPQLGPSPHNLNNSAGVQKISFHTQHFQHTSDFHSNESKSEYLRYTRYTPDNSQKILAEGLSNKSEATTEQSTALASKFREIERLSSPYFQSHLIDHVLSSLSLLVMTDKKWESVVDEILEKLRSNSNTLNEIFPQFLDLMATNSTKATKEIPLHDHHVGDLPEAAISKLTEIELLLKPNYHPAGLWEVINDLIGKFRMTKDYSILDAALVNYRMKFQGYG